jgi:hypothetical protein
MQAPALYLVEHEVVQDFELGRAISDAQLPRTHFVHELNAFPTRMVPQQKLIDLFSKAQLLLQ